MPAYAVCANFVREAGDSQALYFKDVLKKFVERTEAKVAFDANGCRVLDEYRKAIRASPKGGKDIALWLRLIAANSAENVEKVHVDEGIKSGPPLFLHLAAGIAVNPTLIAWSAGDYGFALKHMPHVRVMDRDQARSHFSEEHQASDALKGAIIMGDVFLGVRDSTVINRSKVADAFNVIEGRNGTEVAQAFVELARVVVDSGNPAAQAVYEGFRREVEKPKPEKGTLKKMWDGMVELLPDATKLADVGHKLSTLWL